MQRRCDRNRKRSKRRAIYCPIHKCYLDSVSPKYPLFADRPEQLRQNGVGRINAKILVNACSAVLLKGQWLEALWCDRCQKTKWYYIKQASDRVYQISVAPSELWQRVTGVTSTLGNPSVSEFTKRQAKIAVGGRTSKDFHVN